MTKMRIGQAFATTIAEEMRRDPRIFVMGTDLFRRGGHFAQVLGVGQEFGRDRVRDAPISEAGLVSAGVGAALNGMRPVVDLNFVDFALGAMDEIVNQAAKVRYMSGGADMPLVIRASSGVAAYAAQHNNSLEGVFAGTPGLFVVMPTTPADTRGLLQTCLRDNRDPVVFMMPKRLSSIREDVDLDAAPIPLGRASVRVPGTDVTLVSYGATVRKCVAAAQQLADEGIQAEVIDLRCLAPVDHNTVLESVATTRRCIVVSEGPAFCGYASEIAALVQEQLFNALLAPVTRLTARHAPIPNAPSLYESMIPQTETVVDAVRRLHDRKRTEVGR